MRFCLPLAAITLLVTFALERPTAACSQPPADPVAACSDYVKITPDAEVPASLPAFYWSPMFVLSEIDKAEGQLLRIDGPAPEQIPFTVHSTVGGLWVEPNVPLQEGGAYAFTRTVTCHFSEPVTRKVTTPFKGGGPTPLGKSFGTPKVSQPITKETSYWIVPSCTGGGGEEHPVTARTITIAPADDAPILAALPFISLYTVRLDGDDRFAYGGATGGSAIELRAYCAPSEEVAKSTITPGKHTAQLYARYPGDDELVMSESVEIDLSCPTSAAEPAVLPESKDGCAIAHAKGSGDATIAVGSIVFALAARRRRARTSRAML